MSGPVPEADQGLSTKFCLKWNNFGRNVTSSLKFLLENEEFVDITLSAGGSTLKAHKVVLSASSSYFRDILQSISAWQHPVIFLRDVPFSDLQGIVEFIYHGEVSVDQESLPSFLKTAQVLKVKGLTEDSASSSVASHNNLRGHDSHSRGDKDEEEPEIQGPPPVPSSAGHHHSRKNAHPKRAAKADEGVHKPAKKIKQASLSNTMMAGKLSQKLQQFTAGLDQESARDEDQEEEAVSGPPHLSGIFAGEIDDREEDEIASVAALDAGKSNIASSLFHHFLNANLSATPIDDSEGEAETGLNNGPNVHSSSFDIPDHDLAHTGSSSTASQHEFQSSGSPPSSMSTQRKTCPYCNQQLSWHALSRHIRDMHKAHSGLVTCKFCQKTFRNKNSLGCHMWRFHRDAKESRSGPTGNEGGQVGPASGLGANLPHSSLSNSQGRRLPDLESLSVRANSVGAKEETDA